MGRLARTVGKGRSSDGVEQGENVKVKGHIAPLVDI